MSNSLFGEVVYAYTRANALTDGELIDVFESAKMSGFRLPVAVTRNVWQRYQATLNRTERVMS